MEGIVGMKSIHVKTLFNSKDTGNIIIFIASLVLLYLLVSFYFTHHFFFNTVINGANVSLKPHKDAEEIIKSYVQQYELQLIERKGDVELIFGQDIDLRYNEKNSITKNNPRQNPLLWISSLFKGQRYFIKDLYVYNNEAMVNKINGLHCLTKDIVEPRNVSFKYTQGSYEVIGEVYGNKINRAKFNETLEKSIAGGITKLDLNEAQCYENPKYTVSSAKTPKTLNLLNKYVNAKITYLFGNKSEIVDGNLINKWLHVDENLDVILNEKAVKTYVVSLSKLYDTVGVERKFETSMGKTVTVKGGLYGWKMNCAAEAKALVKNLKLGQVLRKEPVYIQKALPRGENEIGNTYVEINITRQHLWFYKDGELITHGPVVTGNPKRKFSTVLGTYMINYKDEGATLRGPGYEAEVTYWMPFYGNIGIHDATWRHSFGGSIYKSDGTHGCVNAPFSLAKAIFEIIDDGTPVVVYEE